MDYILYLSFTHSLAVSLAGSFSCTFLDRFCAHFIQGIHVCFTVYGIPVSILIRILDSVFLFSEW